MWQQMHIDMKGLLSWQYLMKDITVIRSWNITMVSPLFTVMIWALTL
jgi:plectin